MNLRECLQRADLSLRLGYPDYAAALCRAALQSFPSLSDAQTLLGQALQAQGQCQAAQGCFEAALELDPEDAQAHRGLAACHQAQGRLKAAIGEMERACAIAPWDTEARQGYLALRAQIERGAVKLGLPPLARAKTLMARGDYRGAGKALAALGNASERGPEFLLARAEVQLRSGRFARAAALARDVLSRYPRALKAKAVLALAELSLGRIGEGEELLCALAAADPTFGSAAVLLSHFGRGERDAASRASVEVGEMPAPPEVERALETGQEAEPKDASVAQLLVEELEETEADLMAEAGKEEFLALSERLAASLGVREEPAQRKAEPGGVYLLLTCKGGLLAKYGSGELARLEAKIGALSEALRAAGYDPLFVYADDAASLSPFGLWPALDRSASEVKRVIDGLHAGLASQGRRLAHLLILGGHDIVPFHRLANPADDEDPEVPSDTPYSASATDFFAPLRSLARLPDDASSSISFLLGLLDGLAEAHREVQRRPLGLLSRLWPLSLPRFGGNGARGSLGYTALVWRAAAREVYRLIGDVGRLRVSPPLTERSVQANWFEEVGAGLFNLHGAEDSPFWYGQKDDSYPADYPLFPVALGPENVSRTLVSGAVLFTEACYGANLLGKRVNQSLALSFLQSGAVCLVGSTKISYGSNALPLTGADLLAALFYKKLLEGRSAGEALALAKIAFVREVRARQGYLDGDDQKTAIEFLLLGDPAARLARPLTTLAEAEGSEEGLHEAALFCRHKPGDEGPVRLSGEVLAKARKCLCRAAPETVGCELAVRVRQARQCSGFHLCSGSCEQQERKGVFSSAYVVTAQKALPAQDGARLKRIARVTLDADGGILKLSISK